MRRAHIQAVALRAIADRVESGEAGLSTALTDALARELEAHPELVEELEAFEAVEDATPEWHVRELEYHFFHSITSGGFPSLS